MAKRKRNQSLLSNKRIALGLLAIAIVLSASTVYAILTQNLPAETIPPETITSNCAGVLSTVSQPTASSGAIQYTCPGGTAAFTSIAGTSSYNLRGFTSCSGQPQPITSPCYTNFGYVTHGDTTTCVNGATIGPSFNPIAGVNPPTLTFTAGSWDYCAFYAAPSAGGNLPGFSIAWL